MTTDPRHGVFCSLPEPVPPEAVTELDDLLGRLAGAGTGAAAPPPDLTDSTDRPPWQLLVHAASTGRFALHGSASHDIAEFEPRQADDVDAFGNRLGVYAAADGLWPYYFAIVDRTRIRSLVNAAFFVTDASTGAERGPLYFFSVASTDPAPWRDGTVYLLPIEGFERQPDHVRPEGRVRSTQLFHPGAVRPVARVRVTPGGFPLLHEIRHHDADEVNRRAAADPDGFPWL